MEYRRISVGILLVCVLALVLRSSPQEALGTSAPYRPHIQVHTTPSLEINLLAFAADNRTLVVGSPGNASLWDIQTGLELLSLRDESDFSYADPLNGSAVTDDGRLLIVSSSNLHFWDLTTAQNLGKIELLNAPNPDFSSISPPNYPTYKWWGNWKKTAGFGARQK